MKTSRLPVFVLLTAAVTLPLGGCAARAVPTTSGPTAATTGADAAHAATGGQDSRSRLTVAGDCPTGPTPDVTGPGGTELDRQLLPGPHPSAALVCRYSGLGQTGGPPLGTLIATRQLDATSAQRLALAVLALPRPVGSRVGSCPPNSRSQIQVALAYPGRSDVTLTIYDSGCRSVHNGRIRTDGSPSERELGLR